ncbi:MAG: type II toxin-antitoxin system RatA family toxin [Desulfobulbus sp.]
MPKTPLQATDVAVLPYPAETIWPILADISRYPQWWPKILFTRVTPAKNGLLDSELHLRPMGFRPFTCRIVAAKEPHSIDLEYVGNFITGHAQWILEPEESSTRVSYIVNVVIHGKMVALVAKVIDLKALHSHSMQNILQALQRRLLL